MKKRIALLLCTTMAIGMLSGCGGNNNANNTADGNSDDKKSGETQEISIWHDGDEAIMQVIQDQVNEELNGENITVKFEKKTGLTDQIKL